MREKNHLVYNDYIEKKKPAIFELRFNAITHKRYRYLFWITCEFLEKKKKKFEAEKFDCTMNRQVGGDWSRKGEESNRGEADLSSDREYLF